MVSLTGRRAVKELLKVASKTAAKWTVITLLITIYLLVLVLLAKKYLFSPEEQPPPHYNYSNGQSETYYDPGALDDLIKEIDSLVKHHDSPTIPEGRGT